MAWPTAVAASLHRARPEAFRERNPFGAIAAAPANDARAAGEVLCELLAGAQESLDSKERGWTQRLGHAALRTFRVQPDWQAPLDLEFPTAVAGLLAAGQRLALAEAAHDAAKLTSAGVAEAAVTELREAAAAFARAIRGLAWEHRRQRACSPFEDRPTFLGSFSEPSL